MYQPTLVFSVYKIGSVNLSSYDSRYHAYLLTLRHRILLENPTGSQLVKKFPEFYGTRSFMTASTSVSDLSLS